MSERQFEGRSGVVIGASAALIKPTLLRLANLGVSRLVLTSRDEFGLRPLAEQLKTEQPRLEVRCCKLDPASEEQNRNLAMETLKDWKIDFLIHTAGSASIPGAKLPSASSPEQLDFNCWKTSFEVNFWSFQYALKWFGCRMLDRQAPAAIVGFSSISVERPLTEVGAYPIAKDALEQSARSWALYFCQRRELQERELQGSGPNLLARIPISVNLIAPGFFPGQQNKSLLQGHRGESIIENTPMKRYGNAEELAPWITHLADTEAVSFMTGQVIKVCGGFSIFAGVAPLPPV